MKRSRRKRSLPPPGWRQFNVSLNEIMGAFFPDQLEDYAKATGRTPKEIEAMLRTFRMKLYVEDYPPWLS
jgi:hypothetical protein